MLREINFNELLRDMEYPVFAIRDGEVIPVDDLFRNARILIDEKTTVKVCLKDKGKSPAGDKGPAAEQDMEKETKKDIKPKRMSSLEKEQAILKAWNGGERTAMDVARIVGLSYQTVRKYIPASPEG